MHSLIGSPRNVGCRQPRVVAVTMVPLVVVLWLSGSRAWIVVRTGEVTTTRTGMEIPALRPVLVALVALVASGVVVEGLVLGRCQLAIPAAAAAVLVVIAAGMLAAVELTAGTLRLPAGGVTAGRYALDVHGGPGLWVALVTAGAVVALSRNRAGVTGLGRPAPVRDRARSGASNGDGDVIGRFGLMAVAGVLATAAWSRYQPWIHGSGAGHGIALPGNVLPVIGPASLAAVGSTLAATVLLAWRPTTVAALGVVASGWMLSFLAAVAILAAQGLSVARRAVPALPAPLDAAGKAVPLTASGAAWLAFATGAAVAGWGALMVGRLERVRP